MALKAVPVSQVPHIDQIHENVTKTKDGRIFEWKVEEDDRFCTLQNVFENASQSVGFNIEFKFDDNKSYTEEELVRVIRAALQLSTGCSSFDQEGADRLSRE
ncbi:hypothetical protein RND71_040703 [Anisodus tanguticus]|uniref:Uncharacterized protein n=1 Tax=Anisodus tanguticus TaxID=243964 RepID=A0AAE1QTW9_9SOLA|nr:hypothetical protein RND71_040703 [Anisodus tanguticus]